MNGKYDVYVTRRLHRPVMDRLKEFCTYEVNPEDRPLTREDLLLNVKGRDAVLCLLTDRIDAEGMDVVEAIGKVKTGRHDRPAEDVVMKSVTIERPEASQ